MYGKNWSVPIIPSLHYKYSSTNAILYAATFGPEGSRAKIFTVSEDGQLLVWRDGKPALRKDKILSTVDQPSGTENEKKRAPTPAAAFFSDDGKWLVIILPDSASFASAKPSLPDPEGSPNPQEETVRAQIWHWSAELDSYECVQQEVKLKGHNSKWTVIWNSNSTAFVVTSYSLGWSNSFCQVFKREGNSYVPISEVSDRFTASKVVANAKFSDDGKSVMTLSGDSLNVFEHRGECLYELVYRLLNPLGFVAFRMDRLEKQPTDPASAGRNPRHLGDGTLVRPPTRPELVGSHLRGDQFYGQVVSVAGSMAIVRSEIEPYRRPIARWFTRPHSVLWPEEGKVRAAPEAVVQERVLGERV